MMIYYTVLYIMYLLRMDKEVDLLVRPNEPTLHYFPFDDDLSQVLLTLNSESDKTICALLTLEAVKSNPVRCIDKL